PGSTWLRRSARPRSRREPCQPEMRRLLLAIVSGRASGSTFATSRLAEQRLERVMKMSGEHRRGDDRDRGEIPGDRMKFAADRAAGQHCTNAMLECCRARCETAWHVLPVARATQPHERIGDGLRCRMLSSACV